MQVEIRVNGRVYNSFSVALLDADRQTAEAIRDIGREIRRFVLSSTGDGASMSLRQEGRETLFIVGLKSNAFKGMVKIASLLEIELDKNHDAELIVTSPITTRESRAIARSRSSGRLHRQSFRDDLGIKSTRDRA